MKKIFIALIILFVSLSTTASSTAAFVKGNQLFDMCSNNSKIDNAACEGYIMAINDSVYSGHLDKIFKICLPSGVTPSQLRLIVVKHMKTIPEKLHYVADGVVAEILASTFQCKVEAK